MKKIKIFDLYLTCFNSSAEFVKHVLHTPGIYVSLSAESILTKSEKFKHVMRASAACLYADGAGAVFSARIMHNKKIPKIAGCEVWLEIVRALDSERIAIIGAKSHILDRVKNILESDYKANIVYSQHGFYQDKTNVLSEISKLQPIYIFIGTGQPKQEILASEIYQLLPNSRILGVGGSFDILSGSIKRAPRFLIQLHLEWLYRLLKEPSRLKRQLAIPKLLLKLMMYRLLSCRTSS